MGCDVSGVTPYNYQWYLAQIERDLSRGWTYDHNCNRIPMTPELARRRAIYLIALMKKHTGRVPEDARAIIEEFARSLSLPKRRRAVAIAATSR